MSKLMKDQPSEPIISETIDSLGLLQRTVCPVSGKLATDACVHYQNVDDKFKLTTDWFSYTFVPTETCDMHVTLSICKRSDCIATDYCRADDIETKTFVLLRPGNPFYDLADSVLNNIFGNTWVRTDKTVAQYVSEFPLCSEGANIDSLRERGNSLIAMVDSFFEEHPDVDQKKCNDLIETMRTANDADAYRTAYDSLLKEYNRLLSQYGE